MPRRSGKKRVGKKIIVVETLWPGRPSKKDDKVVNLLEEAFRIDCTVSEACIHAWISREAYYEWLKSDSEFSDRMDKAKSFPYLLARQTLFKAVSKGSDKAAVEFLKRRDRRYSDKVKVEERVEPEEITPEQKEMLDKFYDEYKSKV